MTRFSRFAQPCSRGGFTYSTFAMRQECGSFGEDMPDQDPDGDGTAFIFNLRFPGQYYDVETGLHYNYFRDYEPSTGRYIESDPSHLSGGINLFAYVENNPLKSYDFYGLTPGKPGWNLCVQYGLGNRCDGAFAISESQKYRQVLECLRKELERCIAVCAIKSFIGEDVEEIVINAHIEATKIALHRTAKNLSVVSRSTCNIISEPCRRLLRQAEDVRCTPAAGFGSHGACAAVC